MSKSNLVVLYDLPTKKEQYGCWSPNVWKTRLVLNYKNIPYETKWLKHAEIEPTLKSKGQAPNPQKPAGSPGPQPSPYTVPAIQLPDSSTAMDSAVIAPKLEELKPEPSLHLENGLHEKVGPLIGQVAFPLLGELYPRIGRDILLPEVIPGWAEKKEAQLGMTLDEFEAARGGEAAWKGAEPGMEALSKFLKEHKKDEGPFVQGSQVCYADFILAALIESMRRLGDDLYERVVAFDEGFGQLHKACAKWFENDQ